MFYSWLRFQCSNECGKGYRKRSVICTDDGLQTTIENCDLDKKPDDSVDCIGLNCKRWIVGDWSECSVTCGSGLRKRTVYCESETLDLSKFGLTLSDMICDLTTRPADVSQCTMPKFCGKWITSQWSKCSVTCGEGSQTREIKCVDANLQPINTCSVLTKPHAYQKCRLPNCQADWIVGNWSPVRLLSSKSYIFQIIK
jgi:hypothetical protein